MSAVSTNATPIRYGPRYLDAGQAERQQAAVDGVATTIYGAGYLAGGNGPRVEAAVVVAAPEAKEPAQYTIKQLGELLSADGLATTPESFTLALAAEAHRKSGPRQKALNLLFDAALALGKTEEAETITALLAEGIAE